METDTITKIDRNEKGQFVTGNKAGKGRPIGSRVDALRRSLIESVTEEDMTAIIRNLIEQAKSGNIPAIKIVFERVLGNPCSIDIIERRGLISMNRAEKINSDDPLEGLFF